MPRYSLSIHRSLAVICLFASALAHSGESADTVAGWAASYPAGSIQSLETADRALQEADRERARIQERFTSEEQACFDLFFANACRDKATERRRVALSAVRMVEVQANAFKRRARVAERDKVLEEKSAAQQAESVRAVPSEGAMMEAPLPTAETTAQPSIEFADKPVPGSGRTGRLSSTSARARTTSGEDRSSQIAAYEKKVREAEEHKREVAQRKAEKEAKRRAKHGAVTVE
ncbi:hypothetical protein [Noviherbaspirillum sp.]|uniref:hypothetical protein n=1 Tax=Noviherbaspirillum sp. TaxID=1926288 RepID=UPI002FE31CC5